jgi:hypothetical protein
MDYSKYSKVVILATNEFNPAWLTMRISSGTISITDGVWDWNPLGALKSWGGDTIVTTGNRITWDYKAALANDDSSGSWGTFDLKRIYELIIQPKMGAAEPWGQLNMFDDNFGYYIEKIWLE